jgi:peroxin-26
METLVAIAIQAYAELNRWLEVLPFVSQIYNGLEDCPPLIAKLW